MHESPDGTIIHFQATLAEFLDKAAQGKSPHAAPFNQPLTMRTANRPRLVSAHPSGRGTARLPEPPNPAYRRADANTEALRSRPAREALALYCTNNTVAKISRKRFRHACQPPLPDSTLNLICSENRIHNLIRGEIIPL